MKINELASNVQKFVCVNEHNISTVFEYFLNNVIKNYKNIDANELVSLFIGVIIDNDNYYQHPTNKNIIIAKDKKYEIHGDKFKSFFSYFERKYTPQEKMKFTEISDRLIEDTKRRKEGAFFTPTFIVDHAHKMISEQFGEDWKEKYVVWDCAAGSLNLTRDYRFKELYCSTLEQSELDIANNYNKEATKFQFDFLNDYIPIPDDIIEENTKIPNSLMQALKENKPMIFFINPPYATASSGNSNLIDKVGIGKTYINKQMLVDKIGSASKNLYAQFLYRIISLKKAYNLTNVNLALFCKPNYLSGQDYKQFRTLFLKNFDFKHGDLFCADNFDGCSNKWGISFTIWKQGISNYDVFTHNIITLNKNNEINVIGTKNIYNIDKQSETTTEWIKSKNITNEEFVNMSNALVIKNDLNKVAYLSKNSFGGLVNNANNVCGNAQGVWFLSGARDTSGCSLVHVNNDNYLKCTSLFTARKCIVGNWINDKDEYMKPNTEHASYAEYEADSIVYSLFNNSSNQSSLRNIDYKGKKWNIYNHFFWMSKDEIMDLANKYHNDECYNDARIDKDRHTYEMIKQYRDKMSPYAKMVLDKAIDLTIKSFEFREIFNKEHGEYQINNWDCGYYQLKPLWKQYFEEEFNQFRELYKKLTEKLRPQIYELGFLK